MCSGFSLTGLDLFFPEESLCYAACTGMYMGLKETFPEVENKPCILKLYLN